MSDVVQTGDPDRRPRGGLAVGLVAVLVAAGLAVTAFRGDQPRRARPAAEPSPAGSPTPPYGSVPTSEPPLPTVEPPARARLSGVTTTSVRGRVVVVYQQRARVVDLSTGDEQPIETGDVRLATAVGGSVVLYGGAGHGDFPPDPGPVYALGHGVRARRIATAAAVVADAEDTGVWLTTWRRNGGTVRHVGLDGRALGRPWEVGDTAVVRAAVRGGHLVVADLAAGGLDLWDPARNQRLHREPYATYVAGTPARVLWGEEECARPCALSWYDAPREWGFETQPCRCGTLSPPFGEFPHSGATSPDGEWVALQADRGGYRVAVCPVEGGRCLRPANAVQAGEPFLMTWTRDGTLLLATRPLEGQLAAWRPGWGDVRLIPGWHPTETIAALGP